MIETIPITHYGYYKTDPDAPYALFTEPPAGANSSHLIVYFGSHNGEFRGDQTIKQNKCYGMFVRSRPGNWYLDNADFPLGNTPIEVAKTLQDFINTQPKIKTVTMAGFSMGAFAALLYSTWMDRVDVVTASAAQTRFPTKPVEKKIPTYPSELEEFTSIRRVWEQYSPPKCDVYLQCCEQANPNEPFNDISDAKDIEHFDCVNVKTYKCVGHKGIDRLLLADNYNQKFLPKGKGGKW